MEEGQPYFCLSERSLQRTLIVNADGKRFVNESAPYHDVVNKMYEQPKVNGELPIWMITDQKYRNSYLLRDLAPRFSIPDKWYDSGAVVKADSLEELANKLSLPVETLQVTVDQFNDYAEAGKDLDFGRGDSAYDRYYSDLTYKPNLVWVPLIPVRTTDSRSFLRGSRRQKEEWIQTTDRVLRDDGSVIEGLYAAGNASSPVMGRSYAGAGSTLGPAMAFGYIAAEDIAES